MKDLYEKVAADLTLQEKFKKIMDGAKEAGEEATVQTLLAFAKEAGFPLGLEELQTFFREAAEQQEGELSDLELDMVAGGKSTDDTLRYVVNLSFLTTQINCFNTKS